VEGDATQMIDFDTHHHSPNTNNDSIRKLQQLFSIDSNPISFENQLANQFSSNPANFSHCASLTFIANTTVNTTTANLNELYSEKTNSNVCSSFMLSSARKSDTYFEKRKKNNESAKRSRLARIKREQDLEKRVLLLEKQNLALKTQVNALKEKIKQHRVRFMTNFFSI